MLSEVWILMASAVLAGYFYQQRKLAELARWHAHQYCQQQQIQFVSIAKQKSQLKFKPRFHFQNHYVLEFSGDGVHSAQGVLIMNGSQLQSIELPPYQI